MGLLQRLKHSIEADLHQFFDKKEAKNPIVLLNQYIREAEKQTNETKKYLDRQSILKQELEKEYVAAEAMEKKRTEQLKLAQTSEEQALIDFAIQEVHTYTLRKQTIEATMQQVMDELLSLEQKYEEMKHKVKDMKVRQLQLMGKENVVRANYKMDQFINPTQQTAQQQRLESFESMTAYIEQLGEKIEQQHEVTSMTQRLDNLQQQAKTTSN